MNKKLIKEDLYEAVNGEWTEQAEIPADKPATGGFQDLVDEIDDLLITETKKMSADPATIPNDLMREYIAYFNLANDYEKRDQDGATPLLPLLEKVASLSNLTELNDQLADWLLAGLPLPFGIDVDADMKNTKINALFAAAPGLILPDKTYYQKDHPQAPQLLAIFKEMTVKLFTLAGYDADKAAKIATEALEYDQLLAPYVKSAEENADYSKMYNPESGEAFTKHSTQLNLRQLLIDVIGELPEKIIVTEPKFFAALDELVNPTVFPKLKSWMLVMTINALTGYLSEEFRQTGGIYSRALSGAPEARPQEKAAYYLAAGRFDQIVGDYYGKKYFGEQAKKDVEQMVQQMITVYQDRLSNNNWLSQATREKAILKLSTLGVHVGYPEKIPTIYTQFNVTTAEAGGTLLSNALEFSHLKRKDNFSKWNQPVERDEWEMSADTVNAYYHPFRNIIVFPAAILQAPFYSLEQSSSQNFGGIGAVIAHEISHAFDNNGALFDEYGNLNNWWTEADQNQFQTLADQMIAEFNGLEIAGGKVNGKLTVSENIADAGGLSCALEAAKKDPAVDLEGFFINWATIWRMKARQEYTQLLLSVDVHAPNKLRANVQVQNLADFHQTFDIKPGDPMFLAPEKRVQIW
ncbi:M13 family metallopeptidase [Enterococcus hermanniensis]|uniref:Peptidase M13 n=1 Tax=Enterococcus hermanniensis TaxID=249189 RepID=A0A1L8TPC3_9ENTE|nr:M13-type metalloendopeptidase [Enterococcus hermanniensis]OJG45924.1 peptidase M13 [Enterococcus hermanniensis]